jgi:predicted transcriptional regulator
MTGARTASRTARAVLAPYLRTHRNWAGLSQDDLAAKASVSRVTIARAERGLPIRISTVRKLALALRLKPKDLLEAAPE